MDKPIVVIPDPIHPAGMAMLSDTCVVVEGGNLDLAGKLREIRRADAIIVRNFQLSASIIESSPNLRVIAKHGAGVDNIDIPAATRTGVPVANVPGGNALGVAEGAVSMMMAAIRHVPRVHKAVSSGDFLIRWDLHFQQLCNRTIGLVGCGRIGTLVARICNYGFNMQVLVCDPGLSAEQVAQRGGQKLDSLDELLKASDVVSLHLPATPQTRHLIGERELKLMKNTAILVNTARGTLVDQTALRKALVENWIEAAALDVFENEPPLPDDPILSAPNLVLSPHTAASTIEVEEKMSRLSAQIVFDVLENSEPASLINKEVWSRRRVHAVG